MWSLTTAKASSQLGRQQEHRNKSATLPQNEGCWRIIVQYRAENKGHRAKGTKEWR